MIWKNVKLKISQKNIIKKKIVTLFSKNEMSVYAVNAIPWPAPPCISECDTLPTSGKLPFGAYK